MVCTYVTDVARRAMLSARKIHLAAGLKVSGLGLRKAELDFHILRYVAVSAISSIETGLAYVGIVKIKIPEGFRIDYTFTKWQVIVFYVGASTTMALGLLNLFISGFLVVGAQGLTLRGPPNSLARCGRALLASRLSCSNPLLASLSRPTHTGA